MRKIFHCLLLLSFFSIQSFAQKFVGGEYISFNPQVFALSGTTYTFSGETFIGYDSSTYRSLLVTDGQIVFDTTGNSFTLVGVHNLYAQVAGGSQQLLWKKTTPDDVVVSIPDLIGNTGMPIDNGENILLSGVPVIVSKVFFANAPVPNGVINESYLEIDGTLTLPETGGVIQHTFTNTSKLKIDEIGISAASFMASISSSFNVRSSGFLPQNLNLKYDADTKLFSLFGAVVFTVDGNNITGELGSGVDPGMVFTDGALTKIFFQATAPFTLFNQQFRPDKFTLYLNAAESTFKVFGKIGVEIEQSTIELQLGDSLNAGFIVKNNKLLQLRASIANDFSIRNLTFHPMDLYFAYDADAGDRFYTFGDVLCLLKTNTPDYDTISATLGTAADPGLEVIDGELTQLALSVDKQFRIRSLKFTPSNVGFEYKKATQNFTLYGMLDVAFDSTDFKIDAGTLTDPGIIINNGELEKLRVSVTDTITINTIKFKPDPLTFEYTSDKRFKLYGKAVAMLPLSTNPSHDTITCLAGNQSTPGILVEDGKLTELNLGVQGEFSLRGLFIKPSPLNLFYSKEKNAFGMYGKAEFGIESDTFKINAGDLEDPGFAFRKGKLENVNISLTDTFSIKTLHLLPKSLTFQYRRTEDQFKIFGALKTVMETDTITGHFGTAQDPGFIFKDGQLNQLNVGVVGSFKMKQLAFTSLEEEPVTFRYNSINKAYVLFGGIRLDADGNRMDVALGDEADPGIVFKNKQLEKINIALTDTFRLRNMTFRPEALTFKYDRIDAGYEIFGNVVAKLTSDSIKMDLGTDTAPGIRFKEGKLQDVRVGVTSEFSLRTLTINPKDLTFFYSKDEKYFGMYGAIDIKFDGNRIDMDLGTEADPGLSFSTVNGQLEDLNLTTTDTLKLYSMVVIPDQLSFQYKKADDLFQMSGSLQSVFGKDTVAMSLGSVTDPGFIFKQNVLQKLNLSIIGDFELFKLAIKANPLDVFYSKTKNEFGIYGNVKLSFSNEEIDATLGDVNDPGITIRNSEVESINFGITGKFDINILSLEPEDLTFHYDKDSAYYEMFGTVKFELEEEEIIANLGNERIPGFTIRDGELYEMNLGITSTMKIGSFAVNTRDVGMYYTRSNNEVKYILRGSASFQELWSITTTLGVPSDPTRGLEIIKDANGKMIVDVTDFSIEAKHVNFGGVNFNDIAVKYSKDINTGGYSVDAAVDVSFPPGFEVGGEIKFTVSEDKRFELDMVELKYDAGPSEGIEIGETGVFLTHIEGEVDKVTGTSNDYSFSGDLVVNAGGKFTVPGISTEVTMLRIEGTANIDKNHLNLTNTVNVGAYNDGNGWVPVYGSGTVALDLDWNLGRYKIAGDVLYEAAVMFKAETDYYKNGTIAALGEVDLEVPPAIPVIGGRIIAGVDGAIRYNKNELYNSFAAGWTSIDLLFKTVTVGIEYNFGNKTVKKIGQGDVKNLTEETKSAGGVNYLYYTYNVPEHVKALSINIKPVSNMAYRELITLLMAKSAGLSLGCDFNLWSPIPGMPGLMNIGQILGDALVGGPRQSNTNYFRINIDSTTVNGFTFHFQGLSADENEPLPVGQYTFITSFSAESAPLFTVEFQNHYLSPKVETEGDLNEDEHSIDINSAVDVYVQGDTTMVTYFQSGTKEYKGAYIGSTILAATPDAKEYRYRPTFTYALPADSMSIEVDSQQRPIRKIATYENKSIYFYSIVNDGINSPTFSPISRDVKLNQAMNMRVETSNLTFNTVDNKLQASLNLLFKPEQMPRGRDKNKFLVRVFYDLDGTGHNGFPIESMQDLPLANIQSMVHTFTIDDLVKLGNSTTYYFYAQTYSMEYGEGYFSQYSLPVVFNAPVAVGVRYIMNSRLQNPPASDVSVWLDINQNQVYDAGVDPAHKADHNGVCGFFVPATGQYTVGLLLDDATLANNTATTLTQSRNIELGKPQTIVFDIHHKNFKIKGTYSFKDKDGKVIDPGNYVGFGDNNNYFFLDLNENDRWDSGEPRAMNDPSLSFEFTTSQPTSTLYFVNALYKAYGDKFAAQGVVYHKTEKLNADNRTDYIKIPLDYTLINDAAVEVRIDGIFKNY